MKSNNKFYYKLFVAIFFSNVRTITLYLLFVFSLFPMSIYSQCTINTANASFEEPRVTVSATMVDQMNVPGWRTTSPDGIIEFWRNNSMGGVAFEGDQFIELNAYFASGLFQDFDSSQNTVFNYSFAHKGRFGIDSMVLRAGPPGGPYTIIATATTDNKGWVVYRGTYTVPNNQNNTRFIFEAISTATSDQTSGNFLDAISFASAINSPIVADFLPICSGSSITLTATGEIGAVVYWYDSNGTLIHTGSVFTSPSLLVDTKYKVKQINSAGCQSDFLDVDVKINKIAVPVVANFSRICSGNSIILTATGEMGATVYWYDSNDVLIHTGSVFTSPPLLLDTKYKVMQINAAGCHSNFLDVDVTIDKIAVPVVANFLPVCLGSSIALRATGEANAIIYWYDSNGSTLIHTGSVFTSPFLLIDTRYKVMQINSEGCESNFLDVDVYINKIAVPLIANFSPICSGSSVTLTATGETGATIYWYDTNDVLIHTGSVFTSPPLSVDAKYKVAQRNSAGCRSNFLNVDVKVNSRIDAPLIANFSPICIGSSITLTATAETGAVVYWYDYEGKLIHTGTIFTTPTLVVDTKYKVTQVNTVGCKSDFLDIIIKVNNENQNNSSGIQLLVKQMSSPFSESGAIIHANIKADDPENYEYLLDDGDFGTKNEFYNVSLGSHIVKAKNNITCVSVSTEILVIGYPPFFTPNQDGYNDTWNISNFDDDNLSVFSILIFDRYGKLLKSLKASDIGWDGMYNGVQMPSSDYWFVFEYKKNGIITNFRSHFTLKR